MKKTVTIFFIILIVFLMLQWVTGSFNAPADGYTEIGFPFKFYSTTEGKLKPAFPRTVINYKYLIFNLLVFACTVLLATFLFRRKT